MKHVLSRENYPALHAVLHRYGIPAGTSVTGQRNAREEFARLLLAVRVQAFREAAEACEHTYYGHDCASELRQRAALLESAAGVP